MKCKLVGLCILGSSLCSFAVESNTSKLETPTANYVQYEIDMYMGQGMTEKEAKQAVLEEAKQKVEEGFPLDQKSEIENKLGATDLTAEQKVELLERISVAKAQWEKNTIKRYMNEGMTEDEAKDQLAKDEAMYRKELQSQLVEKLTPEQIDDFKNKVKNSNLTPEQKAHLQEKLDQLKPTPSI